MLLLMMLPLMVFVIILAFDYPFSVNSSSIWNVHYIMGSELHVLQIYHLHLKIGWNSFSINLK